MADYPYLVSNKNIQAMLDKIRTAAKPPKYTIAFVKQLGFTSSNDQAYPALFKKLGYLMEDGTPTAYYDDLRDSTMMPISLGKIIRELYSELFMINMKIYEASDEEIKGAISRVTGKEAKDVTRIASTFKALCNIAQFDSLDVEEKVLENSPKEVEQIEINKKEKSGLNTEFHYNIQIHLPATTDISVYNAIFKSIKDNLM